jgi:hypothetical protein
MRANPERRFGFSVLGQRVGENAELSTPRRPEPERDGSGMRRIRHTPRQTLWSPGNGPDARCVHATGFAIPRQVCEDTNAPVGFSRHLAY